jgi:hypothetical protein
MHLPSPENKVKYYNEQYSANANIHLIGFYNEAISQFTD